MPSGVFAPTQYACVRRFGCTAAGGGDVGVVVAFVSRRVTKCRFHCVLLLLLGDDLLQGKIGIDLVGVLLRTELQEQGLIDALECSHDGLLRGILTLCCGLQVGEVRLPRRRLARTVPSICRLLVMTESPMSTVAPCAAICCWPAKLELL